MVEQPKYLEMTLSQLKSYVESSESNVLLVVEFPKDQLVQKFLNKWTIFLFCSILFSSNQKEH